jgi:hypothetical protein
MDGLQTQVISLMVKTEMVLKMLIYSPLNHLILLLAQEYFTEFSCQESLKLYISSIHPMISGPCRHGMASPQVADGGTASNMEGSCKYFEQAVANSRQGMVVQLGGWARC